VTLLHAGPAIRAIADPGDLPGPVPFIAALRRKNEAGTSSTNTAGAAARRITPEAAPGCNCARRKVVPSIRRDIPAGADP